MNHKPKWLQDFLENLEQGYLGVAQDINSIRHSLRAIQRQQDAIMAAFKISLAPDFLEETLNPSHDFINSIIKEARFVGPAAPIKKQRKVHRKRRAKK